MGDRMSIEKISDYCVRAGDWTISKTLVHGRAGYELWHKDRPGMIGRFDTFSEARDAARREENRMNHREEND